MRVAIVADGEARQGGTNEVISHMVKCLNEHALHIKYVNAEKYLNRHLRKWERLARIIYLRKISKIDLSDFDIVISLQPDSHCIRHCNHIVYFQHHIKEYYDLFWPSLRLKRGIRKKIIFLVLALIVRIADDIYLTPNLRQAYVAVNSETVGKRIQVFNGISSFTVINPGCKSVFTLPATSLEILNSNNDAHSNSNLGKRSYALSFSRLNLVQKGIDIIIKTAQHMPACNFIIAGPYDATIESILINQSSLPPNVELIVKDFSEKEKEELLSLCDVFLAPYIQEDFGITPVEANAFGKPVVYCDDSGELLRTQLHTVTGFMCKRRPEEIAFGVRYCIERGPDMRNACINNASRYSWDAFEKAFKNYFLSIAFKSGLAENR